MKRIRSLRESGERELKTLKKLTGEKQSAVGFLRKEKENALSLKPRETKWSTVK